MRWIKLFESYDNDNEDYIVSSIRDILIELEDEGMQVSIEYQTHSLVGNKMPGVTIEIKGKHVNGYPYAMQEEFEISSVRDYIDTVVDFIEEVWPTYSLYFEKYDIDDSHLVDGKVLKDGKCGSLVIQIHKREI